MKNYRKWTRLVMLAVFLILGFIALKAQGGRVSDEGVRESEKRRWFCTLAGAVNEAAANCRHLNGAWSQESAVSLEYGRTMAAVMENPLLQAGSYGELDSLVDLLRALKKQKERAERDWFEAEIWREEDGMSEEDVRFLHGFVYWYLSANFAHWRDRERVEPLRARAELYREEMFVLDREKMKKFGDWSFGEFLGLMD